MLVAVTDHAAERYRQRVGGALDARAEVTRRVAEALAAGRVSDKPPDGVRPVRGGRYVSDAQERRLLYVCRQTGPDELLVVTLWERPGGPGAVRVPRVYTDALRSPRRRR